MPQDNNRTHARTGQESTGCPPGSEQFAALSDAEVRFPIAAAIELLILQSTPFCNLDCDYCYLPGRNDKRRLSLDTLASVLKSVFESGKVGEQLTVLWHAGEPLVVPVSYYRKAVSLCDELAPDGSRIDQCFQTNALLINDEWSRFFLETHARVGVSVDGPAFIHDQHRKTRAGKGTHSRVMAGIENLQSNGVDFYVISVLTSAALDYPREMFEFYRDSGIRRVSFNVEEVEGGHQVSSLSSVEQERRYRNFLGEFFRLMISNPGVVSLRETERASNAILSPHCGNPSNQQARPYGIVSVDCSGRASTFSPELLGQPQAEFEDFSFVELTRQKLTDIEHSASFQRMADEVAQGVRNCRISCPYFSLCGGGAPANKFYETGSFTATETLYCRLGTQIPIDIVLTELERRSSANESVPGWLVGAGTQKLDSAKRYGPEAG